MVREFIIAVYLFVFRIFFYTCKLFPQKKKTVFVASFGDNVFNVLKEVEKQTNDQVVILKTSQCKVDFNHDLHRNVLDFNFLNLIDWVKSIYHLATADHIFIDNYYGFLAVTNFKPNVNVIQLWHASGAIKQFGLKDPSIIDRSKFAHDRFKKVYQKFNYVVVGSEKMGNIFRESFAINPDQIMRTGIPRTDFFFDHKAIKDAQQFMKKNYPMINNKKVILYAPTYRDNQLNVANLRLNINQMYNAMKDDHVLLLRLHPAVKCQLTNNYSNFIIDVSNYPDLNHLLAIADLLITDYSSIPFEFSLLNKPMIFYAYDLEEYTKDRGFWEDYEQLVPGPVVKSTEKLIEIIQNEKFDLNKVKLFAEQWNQYSRGYSSEHLVQSLYTQVEKHTKVAEN